MPGSEPLIYRLGGHGKAEMGGIEVFTNKYGNMRVPSPATIVMNVVGTLPLLWARVALEPRIRARYPTWR